MELKELKERLDLDLERSLVSPSVLLDDLSVIDERDRKLSQYVDPLYVPVYYHLGKYLKPNNLLEFGLGLGLFSTCFMKSCKTVENFLGFQEKTDKYYSDKFALRNIKKVLNGNISLYYGQPADKKFFEAVSKRKWNVAILHEEKDYDEHMFELDISWQHLDEDGYLIIDHISSKNTSTAFENFCKIENRKPIFIETRYKLGIAKK
ncbi:MAG: hypothetical protein DWQ19_11130 [Crenarchaeota archaeon]|mgnify:CR=1 FL=1|nr:MAG: hypothetical protein DWQ19_11130 [Thermoproteota archaeon]